MPRSHYNWISLYYATRVIREIARWQQQQQYTVLLRVMSHGTSSTRSKSRQTHNSVLFFGRIMSTSEHLQFTVKRNLYYDLFTKEMAFQICSSFVSPFVCSFVLSFITATYFDVCVSLAPLTKTFSTINVIGIRYEM